METRVLMIGAGEGVIGGILTLVETLIPVLERKVNLLYFQTVRRRALKNSGKVSFRNIATALSQFARFVPTFCRFRPQIIHVHTSQGIAWLKDTFYILVAKLHRCRVVVHVHAADFDELYGKKSSMIRHYTRRVMGLADAVITVSEEWKKRLECIVPENRLFTFTNCIAVDAFAPTGSSNSKGLQGLFIGSVGSRKGAFDLLEAVGDLRSKGYPLDVCIAGYEEREGDLRKARARLEELQLQSVCKLPGTVCGEAKAELFREANVFILPSYNEGLPIAVLEAMAAGLAVISTRVGGIPEVVRDGYNGFLLTPGDVQGLSERLAILAKDPSLRDLMGQRSRAFAQRELDVNPYVERLVDLYHSVTEDSLTAKSNPNRA
jgi:glycosyltransferase involved in cell wall biosynthesis